MISALFDLNVQNDLPKLAAAAQLWQLLPHWDHRASAQACLRARALTREPWPGWSPDLQVDEGPLRAFVGCAPHFHHHLQVLKGGLKLVVRSHPCRPNHVPRRIHGCHCCSNRCPEHFSLFGSPSLGAENPNSRSTWAWTNKMQRCTAQRLSWFEQGLRPQIRRYESQVSVEISAWSKRSWW